MSNVSVVTHHMDKRNKKQSVKPNNNLAGAAAAAAKRSSSALNLIVESSTKVRPGSARPTRKQEPQPITLASFDLSTAQLKKRLDAVAACPHLYTSQKDFSNFSNFKEAGNTREARFRMLRSGGHRQIFKDEDQQYLRWMRENSKHKLIVCKNGPTCKNHDWDGRSPIIKVCKNDQHCKNHDWRHFDRTDSPFRVICKKGPGCKQHDWDKRSPMHRLAHKCKQRKRIILKESKTTTPRIPTPKMQSLPRTPKSTTSSSSSDRQKSSSNSSECNCPDMHASERMNLMRMATMRQM